MKFKVFLPAIAWTLFIFVLSTLPASTLRLPDFWDLFSIDKLAHAAFYGVLLLLWVFSLQKYGMQLKLSYLLLLLICCITYGGLIELYQGTLTNRTADWVDVLANSIGATVAYIYIVRSTPKVF